MNTRMMESSSRLIRRLLIFGWMVLVAGAAGAHAAPVKTLVQDTLYRADGSAAQGSVTVRWNGFSTSAGEAVTAGQMTVTTDANGGISIPLIPNTGSSPSGSYYRVVLKLDDGTTSEEMWVVPAANTTTVAAIRAKVVPQAVAAQFASRDYLDSALAGLATVASTGNYNDLVNKPASSNLSATSPSFSGAVTAQSVNGVPSVMGYGAKCDGVTNDSAAFAAADALGISVLVPSVTVGACVIASNITLNSQWIMGQGAKLSPATGVTVTMARTPGAGLYQIFSGAGQVQFSNQPVVYPEWWGAMPTLSPTVDSYPALVSACNSLPYLGNGSQMTYTGQHARVGTIKFQVLSYLMSQPWTCSYGVSYTIGDETGGWNGTASLELASGAVPSIPANETFAWFIDPPANGAGVVSGNVAFGTRVKGVGVAVDGNKRYATTLTAAITGTGGQTVTVGSTNGMALSGAGSQVQVGIGADYEVVTPMAIVDGTHFTAIFANLHSSAEPVVTLSVTNYVSGMYAALAQGSSLENTGAGHAWGRGCVWQFATFGMGYDHDNCASTISGPNMDLSGVGSFEFLDSGNNNLGGTLGQMETRIPCVGGGCSSQGTVTIPYVGGFVPGSSVVQVVGNYNGNYQGLGVTPVAFSRIACGATPTAGQYAECPSGVLTFTGTDASQYIRIYYRDTSPITASLSTTAVEPVPSVQIEAGAQLHINQMFCEGSFDCLNTYRTLGLTIDSFQLNASGIGMTNTAAVYIGPNSGNVLLPKQKYLMVNNWTYGVADRSAQVLRTLVADIASDGYAWDTYSSGYLAGPANGTPPAGVQAATPGLVYPDGVTIAESANGQISANKATTGSLGSVKPDGSTVSIDPDGTIHAAAATESVVATINRTGLAANVSATPAYTVTSGNPGMYRLSCYVTLTQAATTSSTLPSCSFNFLDADTGVQKALGVTTTATGNTVGSNGTYGFNYTGSTTIYAGAGAINYYTSSYATSGATAMQYAMHVKVEYLGQ